MLGKRHMLSLGTAVCTRLRGHAVRQPIWLLLANRENCWIDKKQCIYTGNLLQQRASDVFQSQVASQRIERAYPDYNTKMLTVLWQEGAENKYPFIWMRDNCQCPACFHPSSKNRQLSMGSLLLDVNPTNIQVNKEGQEVKVLWSDDHASCFTAAWLQDQTFNTHQQKKHLQNFRLKMEFWGSEKQGRLPRFSFPRLCSDDMTLLTFLEALEVEGVALVNDMPHQIDQFRSFTEEKIGYVRPTHYGETFSVRSKKAASNVAYTSGALDMHNDMVYLQEKPGVQIMHCISQAKGQGGDHLLVDSFHVANQMREIYPELFHVLTDTVLTYTDVGIDCFGHFHATAQHPTIQCDEKGNITGTNISNHSRDPFLALNPEDTVTWYKAYLTFRDLLNDPKNYITNKLQDGEMVVMDNYRVLHGRLAYQDSQGERHIVSGYWDWDAVMSKRRVLQALVSNS